MNHFQKAEDINACFDDLCAGEYKLCCSYFYCLDFNKQCVIRTDLFKRLNVLRFMRNHPPPQSIKFETGLIFKNPLFQTPFSGGLRIFQRGAPTQKRGASTNIFRPNFLKTPKNIENWTGARPKIFTAARLLWQGNVLHVSVILSMGKGGGVSQHASRSHDQALYKQQHW